MNPGELRPGPVLLPPPGPRPASDAEAPTPLRVELAGERRYTLWCYDLGLACCAVELLAATRGREDLLAAGAAEEGKPAQANLLVVSGTVTDKIVPAVQRLYSRLPEPRYVLSFGSCANSGGPYWDSYCVTKGVDQVLPVDVYVPGCPPRPEALVQGILQLEARLSGQVGVPPPAAAPTAPGP